MAIVRVQGAGATETAQSTTLSATISSSTAGNLLAVAFGLKGTSPTITSVTDNKSQTWTAGVVNSGSTNVSGVYYFLNTAAGVTTVTITTGQTDTIEMYVWEFSGVATASAIDGTGATSNGSSTAPTTGGAVTTNANDLLLGSIVWLGTNTISAITGGFTAEATQQSTPASNIQNVSAGYQIVSSTGTYTFAGTLSGSVTWVAALTALKAAVGGTTAKGGFLGFM